MPLRRNRARKEVQPKEEPFSFAQVPEYSKPRPVAKHATEVVRELLVGQQHTQAVKPEAFPFGVSLRTYRSYSIDSSRGST